MTNRWIIRNSVPKQSPVIIDGNGIDHSPYQSCADLIQHCHSLKLQTITLHCNELSLSETIICTRCSWHQQTRCYGDDERYHHSFLLWGSTNMIFTTSPTPWQTGQGCFPNLPHFSFMGSGESGWQKESIQSADAGNVSLLPHTYYFWAPSFQHGAINQAPEVKCYWRHCCVINCMGNA